LQLHYAIIDLVVLVGNKEPNSIQQIALRDQTSEQQTNSIKNIRSLPISDYIRINVRQTCTSDLEDTSHP
jgi:hypothetical protein